MKQVRNRFKKSFLIVVILSVLGWSLFYYSNKETQEKEKRNFSVILYHGGNGAWESLMEGMKQAESSYPININYIILEQEATEEDQMNAIRNEIANGAEGVVLAACNWEMSVFELKEYAQNIPIVTVESGLSDGNFMNLSADNKEMGKLLAKEVKKDFSQQENVTLGLIKSQMERDSVKLRYEGFWEELVNNDKITIVENPKEYVMVDAYVTLHKKDLLKMTEQIDYFGRSTPLYGIGNTPYTVAALEEGKITKLVFQNEFNMGYLSIETLYHKIKGAKDEKTREIEAFLVSKEDIYSTKFERLLFPIVK